MSGDHRLSFRKYLHSEHPTEPTVISHPFVNALQRIEGSKGLLSTSTGVTLSPPKIVLDLAEKEKSQSEKRRLKGDERVALTSLLGWDGKDAEGRGMSGVLGFVRHQEISFLCSLHVPPSLGSTTSAAPTPSPMPETTSALSSTVSEATLTSSPAPEGSSAFTNTSTVTSTTTTTTSSSSSPIFPKYGLSPCGKPHWVTYQYYSPTSDRLLGEWIREYADRRTKPCTRPGCAFTVDLHEKRMVHDGVKIVIRVAEREKLEEEGKEAEEIQAEDIEVWESCAVCHARTTKMKMDDGA